jgi:cytochrome c oxidase assembly factor CtaG
VSPLLRSANWSVQWPLAGVAIAGVLYFLGGRLSATPPAAAKRRRGTAFYAGLLTLVLAIDSPIDSYADTLFWVHMVQHVLLMMVAPPLLLYGRPWPRLLRPVPPAIRRPLARTALAGETLKPLRRTLRWLASPLPAFVLFNGTLLVWHLPALYDLTLRNATVHDLEHALFFGTALLFWVYLVPGASARPRLTDGGQVAYALGALLVGWVLAVVLGMAPHPVYGGYSALAERPGGLSALADQQLAAGVMWVPGSVPYTIALFAAAYRWLDPTAGVRRRTHLRPREAR